MLFVSDVVFELSMADTFNPSTGSGIQSPVRLSIALIKSLTLLSGSQSAIQTLDAFWRAVGESLAPTE